MESHGGDVELLGLEDGVARIRLAGSCDGCPASASTLELAIKQALDEARARPGGARGRGGGRGHRDGARSRAAMELPIVQVAPGGRRRGGRRPSWFDLDGVDGLGEGELDAAEAGASRWSSPTSSGNLLAYRDALRRLRRRARRSRARARACSPARLLAPLRPAARRPLARRRGPAARAGPAAAGTTACGSRCADELATSAALDAQDRAIAGSRSWSAACGGSPAPARGSAARRVERRRRHRRGAL